MPPFVRSEVTSQLVRYLVPFDKGATVTYGDMGDIVGSVLVARSSPVRAARVVLQREHNQVWIALAPDIGLRRLTDVEIAERLPRWWLRGARRKLQRGHAQAGVAEFGALTLAQQTRFAAHTVQAELAMQALSRATHGRLMATAKGSSNDLPAFNMIEWAITLMPTKTVPR